MATSRNPHEVRNRTASSRASPESLGEADAVELAGQRIIFRPLFELAFALMPFVDAPDEAVRPYRLAIRAGKPAADVFKPDLLVAALECISNQVGNAVAPVRLSRFLYDFAAR